MSKRCDIPRCARRSTPLALVLVGVALGLAPLIGIYVVPRVATGEWHVDSPEFGFVLMVGRWSNRVAIVVVAFGLAWLVWRPRRLRRRAVEANGLACERCLYDLSKLSESGVCPECGQPYEHGTLYRKWLAWDEGIRDRLARESSSRC